MVAETPLRELMHQVCDFLETEDDPHMGGV